jgi:hypothetical protein
MVKVCPHCELPLGEMTEDDVRQLEIRRWRKNVYRATNVTYMAMAAMIVGILWWWMTSPTAWQLPPPAAAVVLIVFGLVGYAGGRSWLFWLRMRRNRPE